MKVFVAILAAVIAAGGTARGDETLAIAAPASSIPTSFVPDFSSVKRVGLAERCARTLAPAVVGLQLYDLARTSKDQSLGDRETDPTGKIFGTRSLLGVAVGMVLMDTAQYLVSRHSPALRCALEARQIGANLVDIGKTNTTAAAWQAYDRNHVP